MNQRLTVEANPRELIRAIQAWIAQAKELDPLDSAYLMIAAKAAEAKSRPSAPATQTEPEGRLLAGYPPEDEECRHCGRSASVGHDYGCPQWVAEQEDDDDEPATPPESAPPSAPHGRDRQPTEAPNRPHPIERLLELVDRDLAAEARLSELAKELPQAIRNIRRDWAEAANRELAQAAETDRLAQEGYNSVEIQLAKEEEDAARRGTNY